ncbi:IS3 family transposase [Limosilactobacillus fermentum]
MDVQHALESHPSINGMCDYVGISRSGYYQREKRHNHQSPRKLRKKFIQGEIKAIWLKSLCIYGAGKITQELRSKGYKIAERTVGKYMRELGITRNSCAYAILYPFERSSWVILPAP